MVYFLLVRPKVWIQIAVLHHFISTRTSLQMQRKKYCNVTCYSLPAINEAATQITDDPGPEKSWDAERDREEVTRPSDICGPVMMTCPLTDQGHTLWTAGVCHLVTHHESHTNRNTGMELSAMRQWIKTGPSFLGIQRQERVCCLVATELWES